MGEKRGLNLEKYFTKNLEEGKTVYDMFDYEKSDIGITDDDGVKQFTQNVEFPKDWNYLPKQIVASKYFYGEQKTSEREYSIKQLAGRVSDTFYEWALKQNYFSSEEYAKNFRDELINISIGQKASFNSPVWFNVGTHKISKTNPNDQKEAYIINDSGEVQKIPLGKDREYPQTSACFIQKVEDTMEGIMELAKNEALLFKYGSGTGSNLSTLRSSYEKLSGGGKPSGPLAYWAFYDKVAGIVKSGGKTRRAAKMDILNVWHPDILHFIESKGKEEEKLHILVDNGIPYKDAQDSVNYQNTNIAVRVNDAFMNSVEKNTEWKTIPVHNKEMANLMPSFNSRELLMKIAESNWKCGDPGIQYHDIINKWHTCPNSTPIEASNPCSEYMFIDNSSCNLASVNLLKFLNKDETFDINAFNSTVKIVAIAQDLEIDNSCFPTEKIAENSHKFRPLGMGYANLGALVMKLGLPYDSDEARATAGAITALLTGKVYETSTEMAESIGTFEEFEKNKEPMLNVMKMHRNALKNIDRNKIPKSLESVLDEAEKTWDNVIRRGELYGFRNSQASVLAPTGTTGRMMDCDTLGIEPEIGLVQTKFLSDGGTLKIINNSVEPTMERLGYKKSQIKEMLDYITKNETIEGGPHISEEQLPIFDCSNKPEERKRTISYQGHLKMMAAVQPFISGAISKTVNLPKEASIEEVYTSFVEAWKLGIKSVTLYRNDCKKWQPMNFSKKNLEKEVSKPVRRKLPTTCFSKRHKFDLVGHEGYLHVGMYEDGKPGEIFIGMSKEGSTIGGLMDAFATSISLNLQHGVELDSLVKKFKNQKFEPNGLVYEGHPDIKTAESIIDYIFQFMEKEFLSNEIKLGEKKEEIINNTSEVFGNSEPAKFCPCGEKMTKVNHCTYECLKCHFQDKAGCGG